MLLFFYYYYLGKAIWYIPYILFIIDWSQTSDLEDFSDATEVLLSVVLSEEIFKKLQDKKSVKKKV